jgi:hypothetical protein
VYVQRYHFALLIRQLGQRGTEKSQVLVAGYERTRIVQFLLGRMSLVGAERPGSVSVRTHQIANAIGDAPGEESLETTGQPKARSVLSKSDEHIVNGIFCKIDIVRKSNSQNQQTISVLFIDPAQSIPAASFTCGHKQPVYHQGKPLS